MALPGWAPLWSAARERAEEIFEKIRPAISRPRFAEPSEDYWVFQIEEVEGGRSPAEIALEFGPGLARALRSESGALSEQEIAEAVSGQAAYGPDDLALVDWQAALLLGRGWTDVRAVLEFASMQLLQFRLLDRELDRLLDLSYEALIAPHPGPRFFSRAPTRELFRIARMQVDAAILYERVTNALKLLGDQYLARVYRLAAQRFRLAEWNSSILRKLETLEGFYQKRADESSARRMEALEWIIIALIAIEIALGVWGGLR